MFCNNIITKNVNSDINKTFKSLSNLINNKNIVVLAADKGTCTVILNQTDYQNQVNNMINEGIVEVKHIETVDNTHRPKTFAIFSLLQFVKT